MLSGIKPLTITKRQAKELLSPKLVDRLIYAAKNFPEMGWLEILPKEEGKEVRETCIVYETLERAFQRIRAGEYPPDFPSGVFQESCRWIVGPLGLGEVLYCPQFSNLPRL